MENENTLPEEESSILTLTDENGVDVDFEYLDFLEVEPVDEENENYLAVEDEEILDAVYGLFKEKYKDVLTFED